MLKRDLVAVKKSIAAGSDVNFIKSNGASIIVDAMFSPEITQYLIDKGADVNGGTYPALMIAANNYAIETL